MAYSNIYLSMTCWNIWRNQFCSAITTNLHYSGQQQEYLSKRGFVRVQYWQCTRKQRLWTRQTTYCNEHLQLKQIRQKGILCNTQQLPRPPWQRICDGEGGMMEEQSGFSFFCGGEYKGRRCTWKAQQWVGLGCTMWNSQKNQQKNYVKKKNMYCIIDDIQGSRALLLR